MGSLLRLPRRFTTLLLGGVIFVGSAYYLLSNMSPCLVGGSCYHGYYSPHSFDADTHQHKTWMKSIPDEVNITSLSIPGTHDTMTHDIGPERLQCQNLNLTAQLHAGLRYFDIRARLKNDELHIYHADGYTGYTFEDVLLEMFDFLDLYPSEAILMRLKDEGPPIGENDWLFEDAFNYHRLNSLPTWAGASKHLRLYDRVAPLPSLGELRSKIFLIQEFEDDGSGPYGLEWDGDQMILEDYWIIPDIYHLSEKWTAIRDSLEEAATAELDNEVLYVTHLSASVGVLPLEAAAGPMNRSIEGMNDLTGQWLRDFEKNKDVTRTGVVIADFPGAKLIDAILAWNDKWIKS